MGDFFDILNYFMITEVDAAAKNEQHLNELRDRAQSASKKTGVEPENFYEFRQHIPTQKPDTVKNIGIGGAAGAGIGAVIGFTSGGTSIIPGLLAGGLLGGMIGGFSSQTESTRRAKAIRKYEQYLSHFEDSTPQRSHHVSHSINYRDNFGKKVLNERQSQEEPTRLR